VVVHNTLVRVHRPRERGRKFMLCMLWSSSVHLQVVKAATRRYWHVVAQQLKNAALVYGWNVQINLFRRHFGENWFLNPGMGGS